MTISLSQPASSGSPPNYLQSRNWNTHTLLCLALRSREIRIAGICQIGTPVELLVARALESSPDVDKSVTVDVEGAIGVTGVEDLRCGLENALIDIEEFDYGVAYGSSLYTSKRASEGLSICLTHDVDDAGIGQSRGGEHEESGGELHFYGFREMGISVGLVKSEILIFG